MKQQEAKLIINWKFLKIILGYHHGNRKLKISIDNKYNNCDKSHFCFVIFSGIFSHVHVHVWSHVNVNRKKKTHQNLQRPIVKNTSDQN